LLQNNAFSGIIQSTFREGFLFLNTLVNRPSVAFWKAMVGQRLECLKTERYKHISVERDKLIID
jgi:hypothetical protein